MDNQAFTLAMYRVKVGQEDIFIQAWSELSSTFLSLPNPPLWGTLIRHVSDRPLFYSFGPWRSSEHINAMRGSPAAVTAFAKIRDCCEDMVPGQYEVVTHVNAASDERA